MLARKLRLFHKTQIAAHRLRKKADREIAEVTPLTTAQIAVLWILKTGEGRNQRSVAAALGLNQSAITAMIGRLVHMGVVRREQSTKDKRAYNLTLTADGLAQLSKTGEPFARVNAVLEEALSEDEMRNLADYLGRIITALSAAEY